MQKLTDKVAIITGASRGLGKAMAIELAREGAGVAVAARTVETGQNPLPGTIHETVATIKKRG
jgi:NAD(P)-dependent dehydrogenase (short-subunit alcohol dehydrogenase family)